MTPIEAENYAQLSIAFMNSEKTVKRLTGVLQDVADYLANYVDVVDCESDELGPSVRPNRVMSLLVDVENAIDRANGVRERHSY